jgi:hypothetical protein
MTKTPNKRGRPKGSKNRSKTLPSSGAGLVQAVTADTAVGPSSPSTTRAGLVADRDRLLRGIAECSKAATEDRAAETDWKTVAALQSQLNGVTRMLLRISGETAPTDTNLIRSPQWGRLKARLFDCLAKKHPKAWADLLAIETDEAR